MERIKIALIFSFMIGFIVENISCQENCTSVYDEMEIDKFPLTSLEYFGDDLYLSTFYGGFYKLVEENIEPIEYFNSSLPDVGILDICTFNNKLGLNYRLAGHASLYFFDPVNELFEEIISVEELALLNQGSSIGPHYGYSIGSKNNLLLMGTSAGLLVMDTEGNKTIYDDLDTDGVHDIVLDIEIRGDENVLLGTTAGCFKFNTNSMEFIQIPETQSYEVSCLLSLGNEGLLFIDPSGLLLEYKDQQVEVIQEISDLLSYRPYNSDIKWHNDSIFVALGHNLYHYDEDHLQEILSYEGLGYSLASNGRELAIGTSQELLIYNCGSMTTEINELISTKETRGTNIYPNPCYNELGIDYDFTYSQGQVEFSIINVMGKTLKDIEVQITPNVEITSIDVSGLSPGLYHLVIHDGDSIICQRFVKQSE